MEPAQPRVHAPSPAAPVAVPGSAPPAERGPPPPDALPLVHRGAEVVVEGGVGLGALLRGLRPGVSVTPELAVPGLRNAGGVSGGGVVLGVTAPEGATSLVDLVVGQLAPGRMLACARSKLWWMTPEWRTTTTGLPPETQFLLVELAPGGQGAYALLLPLIDGDFRATLRPADYRTRSGEGDLVMRVESGDERVRAPEWRHVLYCAAGSDPFALVERGVAAAARLSGGARPLSTKTLPPSLDVFGWCTWDAFYSTVSARGIQEGLASLRTGGINPRFLIIDDGWQMTDVDPPYRKPPTTPSELAQSLSWVPEEERRILADTEQVFYNESMEMIAEAAQYLPPGGSAANTIPLLSNMGQEGAKAAAQHAPHHSSGTGAGAGGSPIATTGSALSAASVTMASVDAPHAARAQQEAAAKAQQQQGGSNGNGNGAGASNGKGGAAAAATTAVVAPATPATAEVVGEEGAGAVAAPKKDNPDLVLLTRAAQHVAGWVVGLGTAAFLIFYQWVVEPAAPGSLPVRAFTAAAQGPLRSAMLGFYAAASDFTRRLVSVRANAKFSAPDAGPEEPWAGRSERLWEVVAHLKSKFGLQYVYCWHGLPAYWAGIMPDAPEMSRHGATIMYAHPTPGVLEVEPSMAWNPAVLAGVGVLSEPAAVYRDMHGYLAGSGVDGVKVDCQAGVGLVGSALGGGPALSRTFHAALESSIAEHFPHNHAINCMCHSTENLYRMAGTAVARASDDFYPRDPASSQPHIAACAYNSLFLSALLQPDWDMFHSKHPAARLHAMARAVSGGAVYVSDKPGEHDYGLLRQLVLPDGSILRASRPGRPTRDTLFSDVLRDGKSVLKVWTVNHGAVGGSSPAAVTGLVGAFNLQGSAWDRQRRKFLVHDRAPRALTTTVRPRDCEERLGGPKGGERGGGGYAAWCHEAQRFAVLGSGDEGLELALPAASGELVTFAPILHAGEVGFAALGLAGMMNSGGAVKSVALAPGAHGGVRGAVATVVVRGGGRLLMYCSHKPTHVAVEGLGLLFTWDEGSGQLAVEVPATESLRATLRVTL